MLVSDQEGSCRTATDLGDPKGVYLALLARHRRLST